jgi:hypothetical protein
MTGGIVFSQGHCVPGEGLVRDLDFWGGKVVELWPAACQIAQWPFLHGRIWIAIHRMLVRWRIQFLEECTNFV